MKKYIFENIEYELIDNYKNGFDYDEVKSKYTDYFYNYDYIVGDWAYGKLRLKGFYNSNNQNCTNVNNFDDYKKYISDYCAYECRYFLLKKIS